MRIKNVHYYYYLFPFAFMWLVFVVNHDEAEIFETLADVYLTQGAHFRVSSSKLPSLLQRSSHI